MCKISQNMNYINPICISELNIYDIFHNDNNEVVIIMPYIQTPYTIKYKTNHNNNLIFNLNKCPHNHTYIYTLSISYNKKIQLIIDNIEIETFVNKYSSFKDEIILSTIVKNEDNFIVSWINFHLNIGITRFIIYDNSINSTLSNILDKFIKEQIVVLIRWNYPYINNISGISGQTTQQNHSIYTFTNSKYIGLFDIDEYINMQGETNIHSFFENLIVKENININTIGSFRLLNKFFYNPDNIVIDNNNFLQIFNCDIITEYGHEKNFVLPKNVITFSVHMITYGKPMYTINKKYAYFNHYYYLNKANRGNNKTDLIDNTILLHLPN